MVETFSKLNFNHVETIILKEERKKDFSKLASIKTNSPPPLPVRLRSQRKRRKPRVLFTQEQVCYKKLKTIFRMSRKKKEINFNLKGSTFRRIFWTTKIYK